MTGRSVSAPVRSAPSSVQHMSSSHTSSTAQTALDASTQGSRASNTIKKRTQAVGSKGSGQSSLSKSKYTNEAFAIK